MRWITGATCVAALSGFASAAPAAGASVFQDTLTGLTFSQYDAAYTLQSDLTVRVAIPSTASTSSAYDAVIQVVAPNEVGWAAVAWGGSMVYNPISLAWNSGNTVTVSSQRATVHAYGPDPWTGATYKVFNTGTGSNGTHWQYTALCTGCASFDTNSRSVILNPSGTNRLAFAWARSRPSSPTSFNIHDSYGYFSLNFAQGKNADFDTVVAGLT